MTPPKNVTANKRLMRQLPSIFKETAKEWSDDNAMRLAAALAYYTVFSLTPLMLAAIGLSGLIFGEEAAAGKIYAELHSVAGPSVASSVQDMIQAADKPSTGYLATIFGFAVGLFGASGVFGELMGSLNQIWGVPTEAGGGVRAWIKGRFLSVGMVMGVCFLLLVSLVANTLLARITASGLAHIPGALVLGQSSAFLISFGFVTVLFAAMFKFLPKTPIEWRDVWTGALATAFLFTLGKFGLEQYLARSNAASGFGAAGALAVLLVWVYYSAQIFFFGAEFTEVYARRMGSRSKHPAPADVREQTAAAALPLSSAPDEGTSAAAPPKIGLSTIAGLAAWLVIYCGERRGGRRYRSSRSQAFANKRSHGN